MTVIAERLSCASVDEVSALLPVVGGTTTVPLVDGTQRVYANLDYAASAPALEAVAARVDRGAAAVRVGAPRRRLPVAGVHGPVRVRPPDGRAVRRRASRRRRDHHAQHHGLAQPAGGRGPRRAAASSCSTSSTTPTCCRGSSRASATATARRSCRSQRTVAATLDALRSELARQPYALVTITGASNVTGEALPIDEVVALAHAEGARVAVDGAQLVPHRGFSLAATDADYVAFSGHKTYAPFGAGALVGRRDWLDTGTPYLAGGGAVRDVRADRTVWQPAPGAPRGRVAQRHRRDRPRRGVRPARRAAGRCPGRARGGAARAARRRAVGHRRRRDRAHLAGLAGARRRAHLHGARPRPGPRRGLPGGRARHRRPRRPLLRAPAPGAPRRVRRRDPRVGGRRHDERGGRPARSPRSPQYLSTGPAVRYEVVDGCWAVVEDTRPLLAVHGLDHLAATAAAACGPALDD